MISQSLERVLKADYDSLKEFKELLIDVLLEDISYLEDVDIQYSREGLRSVELNIKARVYY